MGVVSWAKKFGISDADFAALVEGCGGSAQALAHCIATGRIPEPEYLAWAQNNYNLPRVKDAFFSAPFDPVFWTAVKHEFQWHSAFFPLCEWQDVLLIGCVEPPQFHFRISKEARFVLAPVSALEKLWQSLEPSWKAPTIVIPDPKPVETQQTPA